MKALVVGYGSIGERHARILSGMGCRVAAVTARQDVPYEIFQTLPAALDSFHPEYVVIASPTSRHYEELMLLSDSGFDGLVFVEKPLFSQPEPLNGIRGRVFVGYNLRFHPLILRLKERLTGAKIISVHVYCGQYLPDFRPHRDYRKVYSAHKSSGGGVLRDLSHELDYLNWLCGGWTDVTAVGGHYSSLEIDSDDVFCLLMVSRLCPAISLQINYLDRLFRREITVNTDKETILVDLITGLWRSSLLGEERCVVERDDTYSEMHRALLSGDFSHLCALEEGHDVMSLIAAAEKASREKSWVTR